MGACTTKADESTIHQNTVSKAIIKSNNAPEANIITKKDSSQPIPQEPSVKTKDLPTDFVYFPEFYYLSRAEGKLLRITKDSTSEVILKTTYKLPQESALLYMNDNEILSVGGSVKSSLVSLVLFISAPSQKALELPSLPTASKHGQLHEIGDWIYYIGGITYKNSSPQQMPLMRFNKDQMLWQDLGRIGEQYKFNQIVNMGTCAVGNKILLVGGQRINTKGLLKNSKKIYSIDVSREFEVELEGKLPIKVLKPTIATGLKHGIIAGGVNPKTSQPNKLCFSFMIKNEILNINPIQELNFELAEYYPGLYSRGFAMFVSFPNLAIRMKHLKNWIGYKITGKTSRQLLEFPNVTKKINDSLTSEESFRIEHASKSIPGMFKQSFNQSDFSSGLYPLKDPKVLEDSLGNPKYSDALPNMHQSQQFYREKESRIGLYEGTEAKAKYDDSFEKEVLKKPSILTNNPGKLDEAKTQYNDQSDEKDLKKSNIFKVDPVKLDDSIEEKFKFNGEQPLEDSKKPSMFKFDPIKIDESVETKTKYDDEHYLEDLKKSTLFRIDPAKVDGSVEPNFNFDHQVEDLKKPSIFKIDPIKSNQEIDKIHFDHKSEVEDLKESDVFRPDPINSHDIVLDPIPADLVNNPYHEIPIEDQKDLNRVINLSDLNYKLRSPTDTVIESYKKGEKDSNSITQSITIPDNSNIFELLYKNEITDKSILNNTNDTLYSTYVPINSTKPILNQKKIYLNKDIHLIHIENLFDTENKSVVDQKKPKILFKLPALSDQPVNNDTDITIAHSNVKNKVMLDLNVADDAKELSFSSSSQVFFIDNNIIKPSKDPFEPVSDNYDNSKKLDPNKPEKILESDEILLPSFDKNKLKAYNFNFNNKDAPFNTKTLPKDSDTILEAVSIDIDTKKSNENPDIHNKTKNQISLESKLLNTMPKNKMLPNMNFGLDDIKFSSSNPKILHIDYDEKVEDNRISQETPKNYQNTQKVLFLEQKTKISAQNKHYYTSPPNKDTEDLNKMLLKDQETPLKLQKHKSLGKITLKAFQPKIIQKNSKFTNPNTLPSTNVDLISFEPIPEEKISLTAINPSKSHAKSEQDTFASDKVLIKTPEIPTLNPNRTVPPEALTIDYIQKLLELLIKYLNLNNDLIAAPMQSFTHLSSYLYSIFKTKEFSIQDFYNTCINLHLISGKTPITNKQYQGLLKKFKIQKNQQIIKGKEMGRIVAKAYKYSFIKTN